MVRMALLGVCVNPWLNFDHSVALFWWLPSDWKVQGGEDMSLPCCSVGLLEDWLFLLLIENSYTIVDCHWQSSTQRGLLSFSATVDLFPSIFVSLFHLWILLVMNPFFWVWISWWCILCKHYCSCMGRLQNLTLLILAAPHSFFMNEAHQIIL